MSDHTTSEVATGASMRRQVRFAQVLGQLMDEKFRRNRAALARAAHVSPSALSQYARERATPTLAVLVELAQALDVSLDYLVYGEEPAEGVEYTVWAQHLQDTVRVMTSEAASLRQLVDRIGLRLADNIYSTARDVVREAGSTGGVLTAAETAQLESYSYHTKISTIDLDMDVLLPREQVPDFAAAPGPFAEVIGRNILAGATYEYIIPDNAESFRRARLIREGVLHSLRQDVGDDEAVANSSVHSRLIFFSASEGTVPGYIIYSLDRPRLVREKPLLFDLIEGFLGSEGEAPLEASGGSALALILRPSPGLDVYPIIPRSSLPVLSDSFHKLRNRSARLSFAGSSDSSER